MSSQFEEEGLLLKKISSSNIKDLVVDACLVETGTTIFYMVDTFDIIEYCYPFYQREEKQKVNTTQFEEYSSRFVAYRHIFEEYYKKPIVPNEYLRELASFKYHLKYEITASLETFQALKPFIDNNQDNLQKNDLELFKSRINTVLALTLGLLTPKEIDKFDDLLHNKLNIFDIDVSSKRDKKIILETLSSTKKSKLTDEVFDEFFERVKSDFLRLNPTQSQSFRYFENAYRDIIVIDRCIQINNKLSELFNSKEISKRYIFLYLSSAPKKSELLFSLQSIKKNLSGVCLSNNEIEVFRKKYPGFLDSVFEFDNYNILRNVYQIYLQSTIVTSYNDNEKISLLIKWLLCSIEFEKLTIGLNTPSDLASIIIKNNLPKLIRKDLHQSTQIKKFFSLKEKINEAIQYLKKSNSFYSDFRKMLEDAINSEDLKFYSDLCEQKLSLHTLNYSVNSQLLDIIKRTTNRIKGYSIKKGKDIVRSEFQHLPILLFCHTKKGTSNFPEYKRFIDFVSEYLSNPTILGMYNNDGFINAYKLVNRKIYTEISKNNSPIIHSIVLCFLSLITPRKMEDELDSYTDSENYAIIQLEELKKIIQYSYYKLAYDNYNKQVSIEHPNNPYELEINYLLIWLYRRQLRFAEAIQIADETLTKHNNEPRIIQGRALAVLSQLFHNSDNKPNDVILLEYIIHELERSLKRFHIEYNCEDPLIIRTKIAIENTIAFIHIFIFEFNENKDNIKSAERLIKKYKIELKNNNLSLENIPAFCDTILRLYINKCEIEIKNKNNLEFINNFNELNYLFEKAEANQLYEGIEQLKLNNRIKKLKRFYISLSKKYNYLEL